MVVFAHLSVGVQNKITPAWIIIHFLQGGLYGQGLKLIKFWSL